MRRGANAASSEPAISGDGGWVAFASYSDNLASGVTGTTSNNVYRMHLDTGVTELISRKPGGQAASGSGQGGTPRQRNVSER